MLVLILLGVVTKKGGIVGSSGSGRISDYPGSSSPGKSGGGAAGGSQDDRCARAFNASLEDVQRSDYYGTHGAVPPVGTQLVVVLLKRLVAQTSTGENVGNLPTSLNYLAACIKDGWRYIGTVQSATNPPPEANISADFAATPPTR
jgi:hypothetical protein